MPPPSQKGKFKPRKPAKKIRVGASASSAAVPDAAPSSSSAAAAAANTQTGRGSGGRGGRGGGGRDGGGRGGRGRGRMPLPQGQAFFTAAPPPDKKGAASRGGSAGNRSAASSSDKKSGGGKQPASAILKGKTALDSSEEVVGHLDKAIGAGGAQGRARTYEREDMDTSQMPSKFDDTEGKSGGSRSYFDDAQHTYDSDSSDEQTNVKQVRSPNILPSRLPFPVAPLPVGVGGHERPLTYKNQANEKFYVEEEEKPVTSSSHQANQIVEEQQPSPFVDIHNAEDMQREMDSFFLFQFPSRLPALVQKNAGKNENKGEDNNYDDGDEKMEHQETTTASTKDDVPMHHATAEVSTAPVQTDAFDNTLVNAKPGRLGKLLVYKSGKTVLVLQGPNGAAEIRMNVSEGLTCSFEQQAVAIDPDNGQYVKLGDVHKTAVVTPDLGEAFAS